MLGRLSPDRGFQREPAGLVGRLDGDAGRVVEPVLELAERRESLSARPWNEVEETREARTV